MCLWSAKGRGSQENELNMRKGLSHSPSVQAMERTMSKGSERPITGAMQVEIGQYLIMTA